LVAGSPFVNEFKISITEPGEGTWCLWWYKNANDTSFAAATTVRFTTAEGFFFNKKAFRTFSRSATTAGTDDISEASWVESPEIVASEQVRIEWDPVENAKHYYLFFGKYPYLDYMVRVDAPDTSLTINLPKPFLEQTPTLAQFKLVVGDGRRADETDVSLRYLDLNAPKEPVKPSTILDYYSPPVYDSNFASTVRQDGARPGAGGLRFTGAMWNPAFYEAKSPSKYPLAMLDPTDKQIPIKHDMRVMMGGYFKSHLNKFRNIVNIASDPPVGDVCQVYTKRPIPGITIKFHRDQDGERYWVIKSDARSHNLRIGNMSPRVLDDAYTYADQVFALTDDVALTPTLMTCSANIIFDGGPGNDRFDASALTISGDHVIAFGGSGNDSLCAGRAFGGAWSYRYNLSGTEQDNYITYSSESGMTWLIGGDGDDFVVGNMTTDVLLNDKGNDLTISDGGSDFTFDVPLDNIFAGLTYFNSLDDLASALAYAQGDHPNLGITSIAEPGCIYKPKCVQGWGNYPGGCGWVKNLDPL
jgi:hypothetical protein